MKLGTRALNRILLARQLLLERSRMSVLEAVEHLAGMQAQAPFPPYYGLWTRLEDFQPESLSELILDRQLVRIALMRGTIHLVSARDCLAFRPLLQATLERLMKGSHGKPLAGLDLEAIAAAGRELLEAEPLTFNRLGELLAERWPDGDGAALAVAVRTHLPLVQLPPRGIWGKSGLATHTTAESWLGRQLDSNPSLEAMIMRYLGAFGPASAKDVQVWSGISGLGRVLEDLRPRLRIFQDDAGNTLFDLPDAPLPEADTPVPVRFLGEFDNMLLSYADRRRIISEDDRKRISTVNGIVPSTILVDGFVAGTWKIAQARGTATLEIVPFRPLGPQDRSDLEAEGVRLLDFAAPRAKTRDVRFTPLA